jgi:hypothetical protein
LPKVTQGNDDEHIVIKGSREIRGFVNRVWNVVGDVDNVPKFGKLLDNQTRLSRLGYLSFCD